MPEAVPIVRILADSHLLRGLQIDRIRVVNIRVILPLHVAARVETLPAFFPQLWHRVILPIYAGAIGFAIESVLIPEAVEVIDSGEA